MEVTARQQRVRGRPFPKNGLGGNPKGRATTRERAAELYAAMIPDFGQLSATDQVLLNQACLLLARSQCVHRRQDIDAAVRMSSEARRLLLTLQRKRGRKGDAGPSLTEYLAQHYDAAPGPPGAPPAAKGSAP